LISFHTFVSQVFVTDSEAAHEAGVPKPYLEFVLGGLPTAIKGTAKFGGNKARPSNKYYMAHLT
jgi:hypothetical protein